VSLFERRRAQDVTIEDVLALVAAEGIEGLQLDYKSQLPRTPGKLRAGQEDPVHKFAKSICAFTNASGGWIVYGVSQDGLHAVDETVGLADCADAEAECNRLQQLLQTWSTPAPTQVTVATVPDPQGRFVRGPVIVVHVPAGWVGPCAVTGRDPPAFWIRRGARNEPMTYDEIRQGFTQGEVLLERARSFRKERLLQVSVPLPCIVVHLLPLGSFRPTASRDVLSGETDVQLRVIPTELDRQRRNLEGLLTCLRHSDKEVLSYTQLYRDGRIESIDGFIMRQRSVDRRQWPGANEESGDEEVPLVSADILAQALKECLDAFVANLSALKVPPPYALMVTLLSPRGFVLSYSNLQQRPVDYRNVELPDFLVESAETDTVAAVTFVLNILNDAAGIPRKEVDKLMEYRGWTSAASGDRG
jgi:hypothetical protein